MLTISPGSFTAQDEARDPTGAVPLAPGSNNSYYRGKIAIERIALRNVPNDYRIVAGMPVTADVKVGRRTVLNYLLGRVMPLVAEAMREE